MITDAEIRSALKSERPRLELKDQAPRGEGRLSLQIRRTKARTTAEWYAVWYREGKRKSAKLGSYPTLSLGEARKLFKE